MQKVRLGGDSLLAVGIAVLLQTMFLPAEASQSVTTFQVVSGKDGKQYYVNRAQRAVRIPGPGVSGDTIEIFKNDDGQRWYVAEDRSQIDISTRPVSPLEKVVGEFSPLVNAQVPLATPIFWGTDGPYFWGPNHALHLLDKNSEYFNRLNDWHSRGYWQYGRDTNFMAAGEGSKSAGRGESNTGRKESNAGRGGESNIGRNSSNAGRGEESNIGRNSSNAGRESAHGQSETRRENRNARREGVRD